MLLRGGPGRVALPRLFQKFSATPTLHAVSSRRSFEPRGRAIQQTTKTTNNEVQQCTCHRKWVPFPEDVFRSAGFLDRLRGSSQAGSFSAFLQIMRVPAKAATAASPVATRIRRVIAMGPIIHHAGAMSDLPPNLARGIPPDGPDKTPTGRPIHTKGAERANAIHGR
jgi:hypothetical protein